MMMLMIVNIEVKDEEEAGKEDERGDVEENRFRRVV